MKLKGKWRDSTLTLSGLKHLDFSPLFSLLRNVSANLIYPLHGNLLYLFAIG